MTMTLPQLRNLPKVDLHRHLDCSMRWSTVHELATTLGINSHLSFENSRDSFLITNQMKDLGSVLNKFLNTQKLFASEEILTRLAYEVCEDAYNENILLLELRYAPSFIADGHPHLSYEKIHQALLKGIRMAEEKFGIVVGLIGIVQRIKSLTEAEKAIGFFIDHKADYIGIDLADNEDGFDPKPFGPLFKQAQKEGLHITVHSGETSHKESGQWILDSIEILGAERIGHGVQCIHNPHVMKTLIQKKIPLEICPLSNWLTQAFENFEDHPLRKLYEAGVPVTLNSDDPGVFDSTLTDDYDIAQKYHGFKAQDFYTVNRLAFQKSFIPEQKKKKLERVFL